VNPEEETRIMVSPSEYAEPRPLGEAQPSALDDVMEGGDVMTPRIVVRDSEDAMFLVMAIRSHIHRVLDENVEAARATADTTKQMALSLASIETTRYACKLLDDITCSIENGKAHSTTESPED
jgi:hypothetical protein